MSINLERAAMRGKLAQTKEKKLRLENKFYGLARSLRQGLNPVLADAIEDIEIPQLSEMWADLEMCWAEIISLRGDMERLEKELD